MSKIKIILFTIIMLSTLSACGMKPWVKPYERAFLADEVMILDRDPVSSYYMGHVYDAREGARGAGIAAGGGCGCN